MKVILKISKPKIVKYKVKGKTYTEAANYLINRPYSACYEANPRFKHKFDNAGNTNQITLSANPTITMPQWPGVSKLKGDEKKHWAAMIKALAKHEAKHHNIFETDAKKFKKDAESEGDIPKADVPPKMNKFFTDSQSNQDKLDHKSDHGVNEGVVLPL